MKPARIKQITTEMVVAWGLICIGFIVYDNITLDLNISPFYSVHFSVCYKGIGFIANRLIVLSSAPAIFSLILIPFKIPGKYTYNIVLVISQFFIYWYAGNLLGRFFSWLYSKTPPADEVEPLHD